MGHQPREQTYRISQKQASSSLAHSSSTDHRIPGTSIINLNSHGSTHHLPGFDTTYVDRTQSLRTNATQRGFLQPGLSMVGDGPQTAPVVSQSSQSPSLHPVPYGASIFDFSSQISSQYNFGASDIPGTSVYRLNSYNSLASNQSPSMLPIGASIFNVNSRSMCSDYSADNHSNRSCNLPGTSLMDLYHNDSYRSLTRRSILLPGISVQTTRQESFQVVDLNGDIVCTTTGSSPHHIPVNTPPFFYPSDAGGDDTIGGGDGSAGGGDNGSSSSSSSSDNKVNSNNGGIKVSSRGGDDIENVVKNDKNDIKVNGGYNDNVDIPNNNGNNKVNSNSITTTVNTTDTNSITESSNIGENSNKEVVTVSNIIVTFRGEEGVMSGSGDVNDGGGGGKDDGDGVGKDNVNDGVTQGCGESSTGERDAVEGLNAVCDVKENKKENNDKENNKKEIINVEIPNSKNIIKDTNVNENSFNTKNNIKENTNKNKNNIEENTNKNKNNIKENTNNNKNNKETSNKNKNHKDNPHTNPNTKTDDKIDSKKCLIM